MKIAAIPEGVVERLAALAGMAPTPVIDTFHAVIVARAIMVATKLGVFDAAAASRRPSPRWLRPSMSTPKRWKSSSISSSPQDT